MSEHPLEVEVVQTSARFDALAPQWRAVHDAAAAHRQTTVFQSFEWLRAWWRSFGEGRANAALHVVAVWHAQQLVGVAPLFFDDARTLGVLPLRRLAFLGREHSDYLDVLATPSLRRLVVKKLLEHLVELRQHFDIAVLDELSDRWSTASDIAAELHGHGVAPDVFVNERCPRTTLRPTWEETLAGFPSGHRREIRRRARNLEKSFPVALELAGDEQSIACDLADVMAMHRERWQRAGERGALHDKSVQAFHREAAHALAQRGWLFLAFLRVHDHRRAMVYGFRFAGEVAIYVTGQRDTGDDLRRFSPGRVLASLCMQRAIAMGADVYDFMRGPEGYKYELGAHDVPNRTVTFLGTRGALARQRHHVSLLEESLRRRARRESVAWRHVAARHGGWSPATLAHLGQRIADNLRDGWTKVGAPERSITAIRDPQA